MVFGRCGGYEEEGDILKIFNFAKRKVQIPSFVCVSRKTGFQYLMSRKFKIGIEQHIFIMCTSVQTSADQPDTIKNGFVVIKLST